MERVAGIEPASQAWEACALPLDDTRVDSFLPDCPGAVNRFHGDWIELDWGCIVRSIFPHQRFTAE